jgi:hypothetical protein
MLEKGHAPGTGTSGECLLSNVLLRSTGGAGVSTGALGKVSSQACEQKYAKEPSLAFAAWVFP